MGVGAGTQAGYPECLQPHEVLGVCATGDATQIEEQACVAGDVVVVDAGVRGDDDRLARQLR